MGWPLRRALDRAFTGLGFLSVGLLTLALIVILAPIVARGSRAFVFRGTAEFRRLEFEQFERGDRDTLRTEVAAARAAQQPAYDMLAAFDRELADDFGRRLEYADKVKALKAALVALLGPAPGAPRPVSIEDQYGQTRWDRASVKLQDVLYVRSYDFSDSTKMGVAVLTPRREQFKGTSLEALFPYVEQHAQDMLRPRLTFYWRFLTDVSYGAHMFGGIWAELLGTIYLTLGAVLFAVPVGVISAIFLVEYVGESKFVSLLNTFVSTLAGVPSIVFGLFGLAFFIRGIRVSPSASVLAGAMTLALLILPVIIRAAEEAIRAVPRTYKEAALSLGAGRWRTIVTVILPAALPGILTGIVISMGRAAGETAPIIFTAAVSLGEPLTLLQTLTHPTPALPWNIYNLATEHRRVDEIRHVQYGMVLVLVLLVLLLNAAAIVLRARISRKLKG